MWQFQKVILKEEGIEIVTCMEVKEVKQEELVIALKSASEELKEKIKE